MKTLHLDGHVVEIATFPTEIIRVDGREVSRKTSLTKSDHQFTIERNGQILRFEVSMTSGLLRNRITVRRNGEMLYSD